MELTQNSRGIFKDMSYTTEDRASIKYLIPLAEIVSNFYDNLKSVSQGYASMNYDFFGFKASNLVKLDVLIAEKKEDALSIICHIDNAKNIGSKICKKLKESIKKQQFAIKIQCAIGGKIIARETISAMRKDVTAKLYGGDVTRKRKLLDKQKKGKKRMMMSGNVEIPKNIFLHIFKN